MKKKAIFNWSGGKDSALCLHKVLQAGEFDVLCLLTSLSEQFRRVSMHGVREELLEAQAMGIGLPLVKMFVPEMPTMEAYEKTLSEILAGLKAEGAEASIFGDIFLEDLRAYRENKLSEAGLKGVFPLWKMPTKDIIREFIALGFKTITVCVNEKYLDQSFVGRIIDESFLKDLPDNVDPCGENGEFHTFVFDGPIFKAPVLFDKGEVVYRKYTPAKPVQGEDYDCGGEEQEPETNPFAYGFWYCDLLPR